MCIRDRLFDSEADSAQMENHADRPEVQAAFSSGAGGGSRLSDTLRERTHYFAVRLADGTALRLSETHETALGSVYRMLWIFALLFGSMIVLCALVARQAARKLVDPITVSYTHLDVYKRQQCGCVRFLFCDPGHGKAD